LPDASALVTPMTDQLLSATNVLQSNTSTQLSEIASTALTSLLAAALPTESYLSAVANQDILLILNLKLATSVTQEPTGTHSSLNALPAQDLLIAAHTATVL
jgi:hypothetical protein